LPKGHARELAPRFVGPYKIIQDYGNHSFKFDLPPWLKQRGVHPVFHSSLLRIHILNNNRLFPSRMETQVADFSEPDTEWQVERVLSHSGSGRTALFQVLWSSGDTAWLPYGAIEQLTTLSEYLQLLDVSSIHDL
ncbi:hypothetical protein OG21DRAFT_1370085, partial [Imleria badia]